MKPTGLFSLKDALVSNLTHIRERANSFSVQQNPHLYPGARILFLSANTQEEASEWRDAIIEAAKEKRKAQ